MSNNKAEQNSQTKSCIACREIIQHDAKICPHCKTPQTSSIWKYIAKALKWAGAITALISLTVGSIQLNSIVQQYREKTTAVDTLIKAADIQIEVGDYNSALQLINDALELQPGSQAASEKQVVAAMLIVRNFYGLDNRMHRDTLDPLMKILYRGAANSNPQKAADALAHIGWANYIRRAFSIERLPLNEYYKRALKKDPENIYAHAFWASNCLIGNLYYQCEIDIEKINQHLNQAQKDSRYFSDVLQELNFYALRASSIKGATKLFYTTTINWWLNKKPFSEKLKEGTFDALTKLFFNPALTEEILSEYSAHKLLEFITWLSHDKPMSDNFFAQKVLTAYLLEKTGQTKKAIEKYEQTRIEIQNRGLTRNLDSQTENILKKIEHELIKLNKK